jgi:protein-S-isoprenylcysteine O-methyltransferase Ste14
MTLRDNTIRGYGAACYLLSRSALLYGIGFVGNIAVPRSIDHAVSAPLDKAVVVNLLLLGQFALQQRLVADPVFRRSWARFMAQSIERSTHVLFASLLLLLLYWQWRTLPTVVWDVPLPAGRLGLHVLFWLGWAIVAIGAITIKRFDWFDLRPVYFWREKLYGDLGFGSRLLYWLARHPIVLGFVIAFWATPVMTAGQLLFAVAASGYIVVVVRQKERDSRLQSALTTTVIAELSSTVFPALRQATVFPRPSVNGSPWTGSREGNDRLGV